MAGETPDPSGGFITSFTVQSWGAPQSPSPLLRDPRLILQEHGIELPPNCPDGAFHEVARIVSLIWLDGQIVPREQFYIDPADEGLLFSKGLWESTRTFQGVPWLWSFHLERLRQTIALMEFETAAERLPDSKQVSAFVRALTGMEVIVRLNVTAGRPGKPGIVWMTAALPPTPMSSARLKCYPSPVPAGYPYLSWKTFQYGPRNRVAKAAQQDGFDNALLLDSESNLLESAHANIFVRLPDGWVTPAVGEAMLPGTVRRHILEKSPSPIGEQLIPRSLLADAREVFLTNSNIGIVPVTQIDEHNYPIGSETLEWQQLLVPGK